MRNADQIINARWIITCEDNNFLLENYALVLNNGFIVNMLPQSKAYELYRANSEQNFSHHALMPGFINSHTHAAMNLFRGLADDLELMDWLNNYIWPREKAWVSEHMVYDGSLLAIAEMIRCGTTCFNDMYFFPNATARAAEQAGLRAHLGIAVADFSSSWAHDPDEYIAKGLLFYEEYKNNSLIHVSMAPHSTYMLSEEYLIKTHEIASQYNLKTNIHLQEAPGEISLSLKKYNQRPLEKLFKLNLINKNLIAIHMTQISQRDLEILQQTQPNIIHCPESNMKLVSGACPVQILQEHNINVALGTDGAASNNDLDMFGEMRSAAFLGKLTANNPKALNVKDILKMATINGAKALGQDHITGSLKINKSADFIAINLEQIETQPLFNPLSQIVYACTREQVSDVWVRG